MKIDKNLIEKLSALDDVSLNAAIRLLASTAGIDLGNLALDKAQLDTLRAAMRSATDEDLANAKEFLEGYRKE